MIPVGILLIAISVTLIMLGEPMFGWPMLVVNSICLFINIVLKMSRR